jgi:hypothetical protein
VPRRQNNAPLLDDRDAARSATLTGAGTLANLHEDQRAVGLAHNQIDLATTTSRRLEIALDQPQALALQMDEGSIFGRIAALLGAHGKGSGRRWLRAKKSTFLAKSHCLQAPHPC